MPDTSEPSPKRARTDSGSASVISQSVSHVKHEEEEDNRSMALRSDSPGLDSHLSCGICLGVLTLPYTVIPCLHTFDKNCLSEWWRGNSTCPACKTIASSARYSFQLNAIIGYCHKRKLLPVDDVAPAAVNRGNAVARTLSELGPSNGSAFGVTTVAAATTEDIYPRGRGHAHHPSLNGAINSGTIAALLALENPETDESDEDEDEDDDDENGNSNDFEVEDEWQEDADANIPTWPCPSCIPGNTTGYVCPYPISMPSDVTLQRAPLEHRQMPQRGVRRPLIQARQTGPDSWSMPNIGDHMQCNRCTVLVPKGLKSRGIQCAVCKHVSCSRIDPQGCPSEDPYFNLYARNELPSALIGVVEDLQHLWSRMRPYPDNFNSSVYLNQSEGLRFSTYMAQQGLRLQDMLEDMAERERVLFAASAPDEARTGSDEKWGPDAFSCGSCTNTLLFKHFDSWWIRERAKGLMSAEVMTLPDCWYGRECRTQVHNTSHTERYNHLCDNTSLARRR